MKTKYTTIKLSYNSGCFDIPWICIHMEDLNFDICTAPTH